MSMSKNLRKLSWRERAETFVRWTVSAVMVLVFMAACISALALGGAAVIGAVKLVQLVLGLM